MPQYITLSPDEIMGDYLDGDVHSGTDVLTTGVTIEEAVQAVLDGTLEPSDIPMVEVERHAGQWYCVDNRPLAVFRRLHQVGQCGNIKVKVVSRRGQGQQDLADDFGDLKITVGEKGSRKVQVQQEDPVVNNVKEVNSTRVKGRRSQDDGGFSRPGSKTERPNSSLGRTALSKSLPSRHPVLSAVSSSPGSRVSPVTKRSPLHAKSTDSPSMSRSSHRTTTTEHPQNGRTYRSATSEVQNGRSSVRSSATHTPLSRSSGKTESSKSPSFVRSGSGRGSSINSNFVRSGSGRGTGIISTFVRSGSGRGYVPGSTPTTSRANSSNSNTNNFTNKAPSKPSSSTSRGNGTSSRLSSASFTSGEKRQTTPKTNSKPMSTSHSSTSTSSSNGPDEPRTLSEQEIQQGSESDDELLFVFDGHGNSQRLPIDMLVETDRHLRTLNHRCWKCRKYFQSKQELWIHKQQTNH